MMKFRTLTVLLPMALVVGMASCSKKSENGGYYDPGYGGGYGTGGGQGEAGNVTLPQRDANASFFGPGSSGVMKGQFSPVYFAFDSYSVSGGEMAKVRAVADYVRSNASQLIVAGFTDAVGTGEYNRGLGDRRALAVRAALLQNGVPASRIQTVSFGEEMLADAAHPTSGANRRVEFGIVR